MKKSPLDYFKIWSVNLAWFITVVYCFLAFIPIPKAISTGLDPSWKYAISRLAVDKFIFGKDIIFTYGSFGYLIRGTVLDETFLSITVFGWAVHLMLFGVALRKIQTLKTTLPKIAIAVSLLFPYLIADDYQSLSTEYQILFIFVIILSSDIWLGKFIRWWAAGLGAIAGFLALTKLSIGIYTIFSLLLILSANLYKCIQSKQDTKLSLFALIDSLLAAASVAFIFYNYNYLSNFARVGICLAIALTFGGAIWVTRKNAGNSSGEFSNSSQLLGWIGFYIAYLISLSVIVFYSDPSLIAYVRGSLEIASGYSSAMTLVGSNWELGFALSEIAFILGLLIIVAREGELGFSLALALVLNLAFKHGFVRQDAHVLRFFFFTPLIIALCIVRIRKSWPQNLAYLIHAYALVVCVVCYNSHAHQYPQLLTGNMVRPLAPAVVASKASYLLDVGKLKSDLDAKSQANLNGVKLPERARRLVKDKEVDIIPWEISLVEANQLNWKPRPIFQSQASYTTFLDKINEQHLSANPRDYILYNFEAIDGRHPFFDEPATFFYILCNYRLSQDIPEFINMGALSNLMILSKRDRPMCSSGTPGKSSLINWKEPQSLEAGDRSLVRAAVKFEYTTFGKIYKALFRVPPVMLRVTYINGLSRDYRILTGNSENGVVISHLPQEAIDALSFFKGELPERVKSFSFYTSNPLVYKSQIKISLTYYDILDPSVKERARQGLKSRRL